MLATNHCLENVRTISPIMKTKSTCLFSQEPLDTVVEGVIVEVIVMDVSVEAELVVGVIVVVD